VTNNKEFYAIASTMLLDQGAFLLSLSDNPEIAKLLTIDQKMLLDRVLINSVKLRGCWGAPPEDQPEIKDAVLTREEFFQEAERRFKGSRSRHDINKAIDLAVKAGKLKFKEDK